MKGKKALVYFTFYCSSIKSRPDEGKFGGAVAALHSTVVLLKGYTQPIVVYRLENFTFYCSSIKRET